MERKITIISAYFDIGRGSMQNNRRGNEEYFEYFSFWARLRNDLVVFSEGKNVEKIRAIRARLSPDAKTTVVPARLDDFSPELSSIVRETFLKYNQAAFRKHPRNIEVLSSDYCLLTVLKPFYVCRAISEGLVPGGNAALWLDFGYNHGGEYYKNPEEFDFSLTESCLPEDIRSGLKNNKLLVFSRNDAALKSVAPAVQYYFNMDVALMAGLIFGSADAWRFFRDEMFKTVKKFAEFGGVDDEQFYMISIYRNYREKFCCLSAPHWYESLQYFSEKKLTGSYTPPLKHAAYKHKMTVAVREKRWNRVLFFGLKYFCYLLLRK